MDKSKTKSYIPQIIFIISLFIMLVFTGCFKSEKPGLFFLVTGNANGLIDPCDCEEGPMGGLAKRAALFQKLDPDGVAVRIETGGTIDEFTDQKRFDSIVRALRKMNYSVALFSNLDTNLYEFAREAGDSVWLSTTGTAKSLRSVSEVIDLNIFTLTRNEVDYFTSLINNPDDQKSEQLFEIRFQSKWDKWSREKNLRSSQNPVLNIWITYIEDELLNQFLKQVPVDEKPHFVLAGGCDWTVPVPDTLAGIPVFRPGVDGMDMLEVRVSLLNNDGWEIIPTWHEIGVDIPEDPGIKLILDSSLE
ncbi:MAG: hypothetical protein P9L92_12865 [Candidatus Electryonea clarkiae]|nr:hypothetical protein [Candidatus Electryonea clarkiae]MDP8288735.1 hypothetical protein [Candidatus Electryonea clarkiae]